MSGRRAPAGRRARTLSAAALLAAALWAASPSAAAAQQPVDSVQLRIKESLRLLGRAPAPDTGVVAPDTTRVRPIQVVPRRGAPPAPSTDSTILELSKLAGYEATQYKGTSADFDAASKRLTLYGDSTHRAMVVRQGNEITADSLIKYDEAEQRVRAEGNPVFRSPDADAVQSQRVIYDVAENRGTAYGASTKYTQGATWYVHGDLPSVTPGVVYGAHTDFTSCELTVPHYHFTANDVKIVAGRILVARPVTLYFADVPVAWLPFFAQSLGSGRTSGLLIPRFSINDIVRRGGYHRRVSNIGFYWAMSDYTDATLALDWFSGNFTSLTGAVQYRWLKQFLNGSVNFREFWREEGGTNWALDTNHEWRLDERTDFRASASVTSANSGDFVRRNSFDPREVTQSINSQGGLNRRFDWGNVSVSGTRDQYLTDDRVLMTFPTVQLSASPVTLFRAPIGSGHWFNNLTWSGSANGNRQTTAYNNLPDSIRRTAANVNQETLTGGANSSFSLGNLSLSQSVSLRRPAQFGLPFLSVVVPGRCVIAPSPIPSDSITCDVAQTDVHWQTTLGYQQRLVGSTTFTPSLSLSGDLRRADTIAVATDRFVSGPTKLTFGANFRSDMFRFFPGFGPFTAVRHKISPSVDFAYAPSVTADELQRRVYRGTTIVQPNKQLTFGLNQTFEAKRRPRPGDTLRTAAQAPGALGPAGAPAPGPPQGGLAPSVGIQPAPGGLAPGGFGPGPQPGGLQTGPGARFPGDTLSGGLGAPASGFPSAGLRRPPRAEIVKLLSLTTSVITYDFIQADTGRVTGVGSLLGFRTTQISNQVGSDFLQGLSVSMTHDLFADSIGKDGKTAKRRFDFHLSNLNLGFSLNDRSAIARGFGLFGRSRADTAVQAPVAPRTPEEPPVQTTAATNEATIIPRSEVRPGDPQTRIGQTGRVGTWTANFSYSLVRPRVLVPTINSFGSASGLSQALQVSFQMKPTQNWDVTWRTSYDIESHHFNDHALSLTRDIHDWDAHFDFARTTTGNWYFRFDVSLKANHDFKFDYRQHNNDVIQTPAR